MKTNQVLCAVTVLLLVGMTVVLSAYLVVLPSETTAVSAFLSFPRAGENGASEDELMDPLIAARGDVVPQVIRALPKIPMPMRRYAIAFFGNQGDRRALPLLQTIVANDSESDVLRGDALLSIGMIDAVEGRRLAASYALAGGHLAGASEDVSEGRFFEHRTRDVAIRNVVSKKLGL